MESQMEKLVEQNAALSDSVGKLLQAITLQANLNGRNEASTQVSAAPGIPFDKYDEQCEDFESFIQRFNAYLDLKNIPNEKKLNSFIIAIGPKLFQLVKDLLYPDTYENKSLLEIQTLIKEHISPRPLMIPSRHTLLNRKQQEGENITQFITQLRKLAPSCRYPATMLSTILRDVFVGGLKDKNILDRLFEEDDISLDKTLEIALAIEKASQSTNQILSVPYHPVNKLVNTDRPSNKKLNFHSKEKKCYRCASTMHTSRFCKEKNLKCTYCKKPNHVSEVCFAKDKTLNVNSLENKHMMTECSTDATDSSDTLCNILPIYNIQSESHEPLIINVRVNEHPLSLELDTGSAVTVIDMNTLHSILPEERIVPTKAVFRAYNHGVIHPKGELDVNVEYKNRMRTLKLYVVNGTHTPLLGRDWIHALDILPNCINNLSVSTDTPPNIDPLIQKYEAMFTENIEPIKGYTYDITLQDNAQPRFRKARNVPFALQTRVENELRRLEQENIIEATSYSTWATPVVPIVKPNGSIRLCADYSQTINDQMIVPQHPFPGFEEVLNKLKGGKKFSTLDVRTAFLHIPVTHRTSEILTINTHLGLFRVKRLMFGVSSAPAIWQKYIESVISGLNGVAVVHDDIIVTGSNDKEHKTNLESLFHTFLSHGIHLNKDKCKFMQDRVKYLGYIVDHEGIRKTPEMVESILACKRPSNITEVKSFLGMVTFYGRFLDHLSTIASPLYNF